jgi:hypothetical protein
VAKAAARHAMNSSCSGGGLHRGEVDASAVMADVEAAIESDGHEQRAEHRQHEAEGGDLWRCTGSGSPSTQVG